MYKFKVGDEVQVTVGKDKGKKGKIDKVFKLENKLLIAGINLYKRHRKATRNRGAGIFEIARPVGASKVVIICPKCTKATRVGFQMDGKTKNRICKKCKGVLK